ncbi:MAG: FkbM family methyltransferase [Deltaproteobacteria bacterium]|nr:FkbM family methyltransferase [Deltaproteobacteria bacterium]
MYAETALTLLKEDNTRPVCVDVGSAGGVTHRLNAIRSQIRVISIEADPEECVRMNASARDGERHINAAVGRENENVVLELHKKRRTSSCFETDLTKVSHFFDAERYSKEGEAPFMTRSLDSICSSEKIDRIDYLKIDVEGLELAVLQGYTGSLLFAEIEVNFYPFRRNIPLFDEIMGHMRTRGFFLLDLRRNFWSPLRMHDLRNYGTKGMLIFGDALFALDPFLEENHIIFAEHDSRISYLALLCLYGYPAEALMFIDVLSEAGLIGAEEARRLDGIIKKESSRRRWFLRIHRLLFLVERWFQLPIAVRSGLSLTKYFQQDGELGNPY